MDAPFSVPVDAPPSAPSSESPVNPTSSFVNSLPLVDTPPSPADPPPVEEIIHAFGVLGIVGPLKNGQSGWMTTDYAAWIFLVTQMRGYRSDRSAWRTIRPIENLFPGDFVVFGEAGCDRLQLPLPSLKTDLDPAMSAKIFVSECLLALQLMALKVKSGEKMVLLLIGHSDLKDGKFQFLVTTSSEVITAETVITKHELEVALKRCQGDILVICNSCHSSELVSDRWTLFSSAGPNQAVVALTESGSGYFRGSAFTACAVAQAAYGYGLRVPLPRTERRPPGVRWIPLPSSPPPHSFSTPGAAKLLIIRAPTASFEEFARRMVDMERFLVESPINIFQVKGSNTTVSWTTIFPITFTAEAVGRIGIKATSANYVETFNGMFNANPHGGALPTLGSPSPRFNPLLIKLVTAMPDIRPVHFSHDAIYAKNIAHLRRRITEPERYTSSLETNMIIGEEDLLFVLRSIHVQAVAVQQIARVVMLLIK